MRPRHAVQWAGSGAHGRSALGPRRDWNRSGGQPPACAMVSLMPRDQPEFDLSFEARLPAIEAAIELALDQAPGRIRHVPIMRALWRALLLPARYQDAEDDSEYEELLPVSPP